MGTEAERGPAPRESQRANPSTAMLSGRDIILIASIDWEPLWQSHQEIATRFAHAGNRVLFVENTGVRRPSLADAPRIANRLRAWLRSVLRAPRELEPGLYVYSPLALPPLGGRLASALNRRLFLRV